MAATKPKYPQEVLLREPCSTYNDGEQSSSSENDSSSSGSNVSSESVSGGSTSTGFRGEDSNHSIEVVDGEPAEWGDLK